MPEIPVLHNFMFDIQRWNQSDALKVLSFEAANFYLRMLITCTETGELPADPQRLAMELKAPVAEVVRLLPDVLPWFTERQRTIGSESTKCYVVRVLTNRVVDEVRQKAVGNIERSQKNGKKGGRPKKNPGDNPGETQGFPNLEPGGFPNGNPGITQEEPDQNLEQNRTEQNRIHTQEQASASAPDKTPKPDRPGSAVVVLPVRELPVDEGTRGFNDWFFRYHELTGKAFNDFDQAEALREWRLLDFEQKISASDYVPVMVETQTRSSPEMWPCAANYLRKRVWTKIALKPVGRAPVPVSLDVEDIA